MIYPCNGCQRRAIGCHAKCKEYLAVKAEHLKAKEAQAKETIITGVEIDLSLKRKKKKKKFKKGGYL